MAAIDDVLELLRADDPAEALAPGALRDGIAASGVRFAAIGGPLHGRWRQALAELATCVRPIGTASALLNEGGAYDGAWIESTATIGAEVLDRFAPQVTRDTHLRFAALQRDDGLIPYKVTPSGPGFSQIQIVTPLARGVWNHYLLAGHDREYLRTMYGAMARFDEWLARFRDTRGTGGVEAFCTFDTGHDLSPRFWFAPDRCFRGEATLVDPDSPLLPYVAPDLTANVACQRRYLALIADELGESAGPSWLEKAATTEAALWAQCWDAEDAVFYDRDRTGALVRVQSDVLLRVLACEIGDDEVFDAALDRYLLNTRKFLSHYGFTSLALDDPRFDHDYQRNSWAGPVNFLALLRAPHAFEHHGRAGELAHVSQPVLAAVAIADRFPQCLDPWSGAPGYTSGYSPAILWLLDALERWCGILPLPDGSLAFTAIAPTRLEHGAAAEAVAYRRIVDGAVWELAGDDDGAVVLRDGIRHATLARGERLRLDRDGAVVSRERLTSTAPRF